MDVSSRNQAHRAVGILLVLVLHALLGVALLRFMVTSPNSAFQTMPRTRLFEMTIDTARPQKPRPKPGKKAPASTAEAARPMPQTFAPSAPSSSIVPTPAPDLRGFGQALFGCAPEHYADLTPDQRAHCPKPGEGLANKEEPDLMGTPSHVKDNARWANAMAHKQTLPMLPGGMLFPLVALGAVLDGSISEPHSAFRDPEQWPDERDPGQFMPHSPGEQERVYDDWNRKHAAASPACVAATPPAADRSAGPRPPCPASPSVPAPAAGPVSAGPP